VGTVGSDGSIVLDSYDPSGCYNIKCSNTDEAPSARVAWDGFVENARGQTKNKVSNKAPYYLSGFVDGSRCTKLADSCEDLDITVKAIRAPVPGSGDMVGDICDELKVSCKEEPKEEECVEFACAKCGQILECYVESGDYYFAKDYITGGDFCYGSKTACGGQPCGQKEGIVVYKASEADTCPKIGGFQCKGGNHKDPEDSEGSEESKSEESKSEESKDDSGYKSEESKYTSGYKSGGKNGGGKDRDLTFKNFYKSYGGDKNGGDKSDDSESSGDKSDSSGDSDKSDSSGDKSDDSEDSGDKGGAGLSNWNTYKICKGDYKPMCDKKCEYGECDCKYAESLCDGCGHY